MIEGLRNIIVHDYKGISLKSMWYVIRYDINKLREDIQEIINKEKA